MKKFTYVIFGGLISLCGGLQGDDDAFIDSQNVSKEQMTDAESVDGKIFHISTKADWVQQAKVDKRGFHHNHVKFAQANAQGRAIVYYNKECKEGLALGLGYDHVYFSWNKNFYFNRKNFSDLSLDITGFSERFCGWLWQAQVTVNVDTKYWNLSEYANYDLFLWGRYEFCCDLNFHAGFFAQTGMKIDHIYPVLGFDWRINDTWKLNLIYPFNMSLVYTYNENLSGALAIRLFNVRYRVGKHAPMERGLFQYRSTGLELALNYENKWISANIHCGSILGGQFVISDNNNKHKHHFNFDGSPYIGGEIAVKF